MSNCCIHEVRVMPISELHPAPYNPRKVLKPEAPAYRKLRASLMEFGLVEPLVWNERSRQVVGGHLRLRILQELGVTEVPVTVVHLDERREKALNVVLNNAEAQGRYNTTKLADLLAELDGLPELTLTGFDESTLANLRFEPADRDPEPPTERIEITLVMSPETYANVQQNLEFLVREYAIESHIRNV